MYTDSNGLLLLLILHSPLFSKKWRFFNRVIREPQSKAAGGKMTRSYTSAPSNKNSAQKIITDKLTTIVGVACPANIQSMNISKDEKWAAKKATEIQKTSDNMTP